MYIKAGYAERVELAYGKVARNVSLDNDSTPGATQIPLYKPPVCAGSQAGRTVVLVLCIVFSRGSLGFVIKFAHDSETRSIRSTHTCTRRGLVSGR